MGSWFTWQQFVLCLSEAFAVGMIFTLVSVAGPVGELYAPHQSLATLPMSVFLGGMAVVMFPASYLCVRFGRRKAFLSGAGMGVMGGLVSLLAVMHGNYWLLCLGTFMTGLSAGFSSYYRFAASDGVRTEYIGRVSSVVLGAGIAGAVAGPELARNLEAAKLLPPNEGPFVVMTVLAAATVVVMLFYPSQSSSIPTRSLSLRAFSGLANRRFILAAFAGGLGFAGMALPMIGAPIAMGAAGLCYGSVAGAVELHVVAMYMPFFVSGWLADRFGARTMIATGFVIYAITAVAMLNWVGFPGFLVSLTLSGLGWNAIFIGATALISAQRTHGNQAELEASNETLMYGTNVLAALVTGVLATSGGWPLIALGVFAIASMGTLLWIVEALLPAGAKVVE